MNPPAAHRLPARFGVVHVDGADGHRDHETARGEGAPLGRAAMITSAFGRFL